MSIAIDHNGRDLARPFVEAARVTYLAAVDDQSVTTAAFGFKVVPNGILLDRDGTIRYAKLGGFSIDNPGDVATVERFLKGQDPGPSPSQEPPYFLNAIEADLVETKLRLGGILASLDRRDEAVAEWRGALTLDPQNLVIRKQIWATLHPERFHPTIDWGWQRETLARERAEEVAAGVCGPDGCRLLVPSVAADDRQVRLPGPATPG